MFAIAVLFFLVVWVFITLFSMHIGSSQIKKRWKKPQAGFVGGFLGFMLTMGGFMVYWTVEYIQIQRTVTHLCETEGGITVYVTPEEWRQQIGEDEWANLVPYNRSQQNELEKNDRIIDGIDYFSVVKYNKYLIRYSNHEDVNKYIGRTQWIIMDIEHKKQLLKATYISAGAGTWLAGGSYKSWLNNIQSCSQEVKDNFNQLIKQYSNNLTGENT